MKKMLLLLVLLLSLSTNAQIPEEAFEITNSLSNLWIKENSEEAIKATQKLNEIFKPFLIDNFHTQLAQSILRNKGKGNESKYLNRLYDKNIASITKIIDPIYLWDRSLKTNTDKEANTLLKKYYSKLSDTTDFNSKIELYGFLMLQEFENKKIGRSSLKDKILDKLATNLSANPLIDKTNLEGRKINYERSHYRFLLAYSYNLLFDKNNTEASIKNAAKYSPDAIDLQNKSGYFYDAHLLINGPDNIDYKKKYFDYLYKIDKADQALNTLLEETYLQPTDKNLEGLKDYYTKTTNDKDFGALWYSYINSKMSDVPKIKVEFEFEILDLSKKRSHWVYIDVWGTWCSPCIKELPEFNTIAKEYNEKSDSKIKFYTFSYGSKNLKEFMLKNNYTFPVVEINEDITKLFKVSGYPTKILISPNNKYLKIPFGVNWQEYMTNYSLIK